MWSRLPRLSRFQGRLARRLILVFVLAGTLPVLLAGGLAYRELVQITDQQQARALREQAKGAAMNLLGQLQLVEAAIRLPAAGGLEQALLPAGLGHVERLPVGSLRLGDEVQHPLTEGRAVLQWQGAAGAVDIQMLWQDPVSGSISRAHLDADRWLATAAASGTDQAVAIAPAPAEPWQVVDPAGLLSAASGGDWRSASWILPLDLQFQAQPLRIVVGARRQSVAAGIGALRVGVPLALVAALALAVWLAASQLRRYLGPLAVLTVATRKLADRDFDASVAIDTNDEFALLGRDFNSMAANLRQQFTALETVAELDRLLLSSPRLDVILATMLPRMASVLRADRICVLLADEDDAQCMRAHDHWRDGGHLPARRVPVSQAETQSLAAGQGGSQHRLASVIFQAPAGAEVRFLPLGQSGGRVGLLCLCWLQPSAGRDVELELGFADRLSVALANISHEQQLLHRARFDGLTGLANREYFTELLQQEVDRARDGSTCSALLYVDLDEFKKINDSAGHEAGDCVLVEIAARLKACAENRHTVARLGGDEFAIIVRGNGEEYLPGILADRVRMALQRPVVVTGLQRRMSASIGLARMPEHGEEVDELLRNADLAMYQAKERGRDQIATYSPDLLAQMNERVSLEIALEKALSCGELDLYYQPIVECGGTVSAEALLRWKGPDGRYICPAQFIPVAEQSGLIHGVGKFVIQRACRDLAEWRASSVTVPYVSINVAPRHMVAEDFLPTLLQALTSNGLKPADLQLEITEGAIADGVAAQEMIRALARHGFRIAMDDFGTGYSSLSHLHLYPFDVVKVDRSFVTEIPGSQVAMQLVGTIVQMAHGLGKTVVAEGVETHAQWLTLQEFGCDAMQGYFFGKAIPAKEFVQHMQRDAVARDRPQQARHFERQRDRL